MIDAFSNEPVGANPSLYADPKAAFAVITVRPTNRNGGFRPVMPLLSRGQCFADDAGELWTVLRAAVLTEFDKYSGDELPYFYAYEYEVVNGKRVLD